MVGPARLPVALMVCVVASCSESSGPADRCAALVDAGELTVVIASASGFAGELLTVGDSVTLGASVRPIEAASEDIYGLCQVSYGAPVTATITWQSQDTTVARVWPSGGLKARAAGETVVYARDAARGLEAEWSVVVLP